MGVAGKLAEVMFYAGLILLVPVAYGYYIGEIAWQAIAVSALVLMLPSLPGLLPKVFRYLVDSVKALFRRELPWNYGDLVDLIKSRPHSELTLGEALALTSLAWLVIPAITAFPYTQYGLSPLDAFFESMSGWTSTGLSVIALPEQMPQCMLLFRSLTQWVGGLGIVILLLAVFRSIEGKSLLRAEGRDSISSDISSTVRTYWKIYLLVTLLALGALIVAGLDAFNALNLALSGISNGGFFPFSHYDFSELQKLTLAVIMFGGATSFLFYRSIFKGRFREALFDEEFVLYIGLLALAILSVLIVGGEEWHNGLLNSVSAMAGGGFSIGDIAIMHEFSKYAIILLMICGGMYGSTTGAVKVWRILLAIKSIALRVRASFLPSGVVQVVKINGRPIENDAMMETAIFIFSYFSLLVLSAGFFMAIGYGAVDSLFISASSAGNVGLTTFSMDELGVLSKAFLIVLMYLGRIEIFPSLALARFLVHLVKR